MFKITIQETKDVRKTLPKEWLVVGKEEVERDSRFVLDGEKKTRVDDVMGYTPETETVQTETREIYTQEVDELNLHAVIAAVNGIAQTSLPKMTIDEAIGRQPQPRVELDHVD